MYKIYPVNPANLVNPVLIYSLIRGRSQSKASTSTHVVSGHNTGSRNYLKVTNPGETPWLSPIPACSTRSASKGELRNPHRALSTRQ